ncbi:MBL fold metallo-hydrolase [Balamuthia mandrillaris]
MVWWWTFGQVPELEGREIVELVEAKKKGAQDCPQFQIVDVRTLSEYHAGHIEGAIHCSLFPPWSFRSRLERLNLNRIDRHGFPLQAAQRGDATMEEGRSARSKF